jgi:hypothetical protein
LAEPPPAPFSSVPELCLVLLRENTLPLKRTPKIILLLISKIKTAKTCYFVTFSNGIEE